VVVKRLVNASLRRLSQTGIGSHLVSPPLYSVAIEPTNGCNLDCVMCYSKGRKEGIMDWQLYKKIIDEGVSMRRDLGVGLNFGGESLLHPKFSDMVE